MKHIPGHVWLPEGKATLATSSKMPKETCLVGGDWNMTFISPYIGNNKIPTDFHIFQRDWNHQPDKAVWRFPKMEVPQIIHFCRISLHSTIYLGYPNLGNLYIVNIILWYPVESHGHTCGFQWGFMMKIANGMSYYLELKKSRPGIEYWLWSAMFLSLRFPMKPGPWWCGDVGSFPNAPRCWYMNPNIYPINRPVSGKNTSTMDHMGFTVLTIRWTHTCHPKHSVLEDTAPARDASGLGHALCQDWPFRLCMRGCVN